MEEAARRQFIELEETHFWFVGRRRIFLHLLDRELDGRSDLRLLDVGCGAGGMLAPLSKYGEVTGLDVSEEMVEVCHSRGFERVVVGDAYNLPNERESTDVVTLFDTIEHISDDVRVLQEAHNVLAPRGHLFLSVPAYKFLYANNDRVAHHKRRYTAPQIRQKLTGVGFESIRVTYFNTFLFPLILPAVLGKKLREQVSSPYDTTNLSHKLPPGLNRGLAAIMGGERHLLFRVPFPVGHSIIGLARKR